MDIIKLTGRNIEQNDEIAESLKADIKETFSDMLKFLGKENFLRWVRVQDISKIARQTIYQVCTDEEDKYLKDHKNVLGYHQSPNYTNGNKRRIVFKRDVGEGKSVRSHETWHALANGLGGYSRFFGEGVTEYLSKILYNNSRYTYKENVDVIDLMVSMYGNSVVREYLTMSGGRFFKDIENQILNSNLASRNGINISEMISKMDKEFNLYHDAAYGNDAPQNGSLNLIEGKKLLMEIYFAYERSKIDNLEYYKDGKIDFRKYNEQLNRVINKAFDYGIPANELLAGYKALTVDLIESSHLLEGLEGEKRENTKNQILEQIYEQFNCFTLGKEIKEIDQEEEPYKTLNQDAGLKLAEKAMKIGNFTDSNGKFDYIKYFNKLSLLRQKTGMSQYVFNAIVAKTNLEISDNPKLFDNFSKSVLGVHSAIVKMEEERKSDVSAVKLKKARIESVDGVTFLEKKDGEYQVLVVDNKTGKIETLPLDRKVGRTTPLKGIYTDRITNGFTQGHGYPEEIIEDLKKGNLVFRVKNIFRQSLGSYISINEDTGEATFVNQNSLFTTRDNGGYWKNGFEEMKDTIVSETLLEGFRAKISKGEYSEFSTTTPCCTTERVNFEPSYIKFDDFIDDYLAITKFLPIDKEHKHLKELTARVVERTHTLNTIPIRDDDDKIENPDPSKPTHRQRFEEAKTEFAEHKKEIVTKVERIVALRQKGELSERQKRTIEMQRNTLEGEEMFINEMVQDLKPKQSMALYFMDSKAIADVIDASKQKTATSDFASMIIAMEKDKKEKSVEEDQK